MQRSVSLGQEHIDIGLWAIGNALFGRMKVQYKKIAMLRNTGFLDVKIRGRNMPHRTVLEVGRVCPTSRHESGTDFCCTVVFGHEFQLSRRDLGRVRLSVPKSRVGSGFIIENIRSMSCRTRRIGRTAQLFNMKWADHVIECRSLMVPFHLYSPSLASIDNLWIRQPIVDPHLYG